MAKEATTMELLTLVEISALAELSAFREQAQRIAKKIKQLSRDLCLEQAQLRGTVERYNKRRHKFLLTSTIGLTKEPNFPPFLEVGRDGELVVHETKANVGAV